MSCLLGRYSFLKSSLNWVVSIIIERHQLISNHIHKENSWETYILMIFTPSYDDQPRSAG